MPPIGKNPFSGISLQFWKSAGLVLGPAAGAVLGFVLSLILALVVHGVLTLIGSTVLSLLIVHAVLLVVHTNHLPVMEAVCPGNGNSIHPPGQMIRTNNSRSASAITLATVKKPRKCAVLAPGQRI